eukprot:TRINITY_DN3910_c0_g1_i1.p1 TRINITY_DN3910_c0_g1~~TRINITY_DN3910_c0_g1_i1.p1  ORF type:complete len:276 (-),score=63.52 TRINITY_DN3910_c0_g1_i1:127-954(-)
MNNDTEENKTEIKMNKSDFMCKICDKILYKPVVSKCGHTFCQKCITKDITKCPKCNEEINITGVSILLEQLINMNFNKEIKEREIEVNKNKKELQIPIFILKTVLFPSRNLPLHIFEMKYKMLLKHCNEKNGVFGVVSSINGKISSYGTLSKVQQTIELADGRFLINTVGFQRFKIKNHWESKDGYSIANIKLLKEGSFNQQDTEEVRNLNDKFFQLFKGNLPSIESKYGKTPTNINFIYWLLDFLPVSLSVKQSFLELSTYQERITALKHIVNF